MIWGHSIQLSWKCRLGRIALKTAASLATSLAACFPTGSLVQLSNSVLPFCMAICTAPPNVIACCVGFIVGCLVIFTPQQDCLESSCSTADLGDQPHRDVTPQELPSAWLAIERHWKRIRSSTEMLAARCQLQPLQACILHQEVEPLLSNKIPGCA
jgi:hypothetical protein